MSARSLDFERLKCPTIHGFLLHPYAPLPCTLHSLPVHTYHSALLLTHPGSDDHLACVFELRPGPGVGSLGSSTPNIENWRLKAALRGHGNNVVDVAWSPDDALLATASLDGTAAVWAIASGQRVARLDAHTNFVKGIAWDPVGSYLATQVGLGNGWVVFCERQGSGVAFLAVQEALCVSPLPPRHDTPAKVGERPSTPPPPCPHCIPLQRPVG